MGYKSYRTGFRRQNLYTLTALDINNQQEIAKYFLLTILELQIDVTKLSQELVDCYFLLFVRQCIEDEITIEHNLPTLDELDYYSSFYQINDLGFLSCHNELHKLMGADYKTKVLLEFKEFLAKITYF